VFALQSLWKKLRASTWVEALFDTSVFTTSNNYYCGGCVDVGFSCFSPALSLSLQLLETISTLVTLNSCPALAFVSVELVEVEPAEAAVPAFSPEALAAMLFWKAP
jgi:hypothetical protein